MKDIVTPVPPEETRGVIKKCLENAALVNYEQLSNEAKVDGTCFPLVYDTNLVQMLKSIVIFYSLIKQSHLHP